MSQPSCCSALDIVKMECNEVRELLTIHMARHRVQANKSSCNAVLLCHVQSNNARVASNLQQLLSPYAPNSRLNMPGSALRYSGLSCSKKQASKQGSKICQALGRAADTLVRDVTWHRQARLCL
jgi:hypothetical protein